MSAEADRGMKLRMRWGGKVFLSLADQAMFSGATFVLNILEARWLSPSDYGAFAVAFSVFLFVSGFHNALILEPMSVLGPARYSELPSEYLDGVLWTHAAVSSGALLLMAAAGLVFRAAGLPVSGPLLGLAIGSPAILSFWLFRRICYLKTRPELALAGSLLHALILVLGLLAAHRLGRSSPFSAFLILGLSGLAASLLLRRSIGVESKRISWTAIKPAVHSFLSRHWSYARWVLGSAFVFWLSGAVYPPLIAGLLGLEATGVFQAMQNLIRPLQNVLVACGLLFLPWVSRQRAGKGEGCAHRIMVGVMAVHIAAACLYLAALMIGKRWIVPLLYGRGYYDGFLWLLGYLGAASLIGAMIQGLHIWLKAFERPEAVFWSQTAGAAATLTVGLLLVWRLKLCGAASGLVLSAAVMALVLLYFLFRSVPCRR